MSTKALALCASVCIVLFVLTGCGSAGANSTTGGGTSAIAVVFDPAPPQSIQTGSTAPMGALVSNDSASAGVVWSCAPVGSCGSFSPSQTGSGANTTYTAPATVPNGGTVTLTATSVSDATKSVGATVSIVVPAISVSISPASVSVVTGASQPFTATVSNDPSNAGVTWSLVQNGNACAPACGSLNNQTSTSVTYTAPSQVPTPAAVTLSATSVADTSKNSSASITVTAASPLSLLQGQYAFEMESAPGGMVGSFTADGAGSITGGMYDGTWGIGVGILSGSYTVGNDHRGTLSFTDANHVAWNFAFALGSSTSGVAAKGSMTEEDSNSWNSTGFFELQDPTSFASGYSGSGSYAFGLTGWDANANPEVMVGSAALSTGGAISSGLFDDNDSGTVTARTAFTGTITMSPTGRGTITTTVSGKTSGFVYAVDSSHLLAVFPVASSWQILVGELVQQSGGPYAAASLNGTAIIESQTNDSSSQPEALVGIATFSSGGTFSYSADENDGGTVTSPSISGSLSITDAPNGRFTLAATGGDTDAVYLIGPNEGFTADVTSGAQAAFGRFEPQAAGPFTNSSIDGTLYLQTLPLVSGAYGNSQPMSVTSGVATLAGGNLTETTDTNTSATVYSDVASTDTYTVGSNGRVTTGSGKTVLYIVSPAPSPKVIVLDTAGSSDPNPWVQIMQP